MTYYICVRDGELAMFGNKVGTQFSKIHDKIDRNITYFRGLAVGCVFFDQASWGVSVDGICNSGVGANVQTYFCLLHVV